MTRSGRPKNQAYVVLFWTALWLFEAAFPSVQLFFPDALFGLSVLRSAFYVVSLGLVLAVALGARMTLPTLRQGYDKAVLAFWIVAVVSVLLSSSLGPSNVYRTIGLLARDLSFSIAVLLLLRLARDPIRLFGQFIPAFALGTCLYVLTILVTYGGGSFYTVGRFGGELASPTIVGFRAGLAFLLLLTSRSRLRHPLWIAVLAFLGTATIAAFSKVVLVGLLVSLVVWWLGQGLKAKLVRGMQIALILYVILISGGPWILDQVRSYVESPRASVTLTGRTVLWTYSWDLITRYPVRGVGYAMLEDRLVPIARRMGWSVEFNNLKQAHNAYLDAWVKQGAVGLALLLVIVWLTVRAGWSLKRMGRTGDKQLHSFVTHFWPVLALILVRSSVEGALNGGLDFVVLTSMGYAASLRLSKLQRSDARVS